MHRRVTSEGSGTRERRRRYGGTGVPSWETDPAPCPQGSASRRVLQRSAAALHRSGAGRGGISCSLERRRIAIRRPLLRRADGWVDRGLGSEAPSRPSQSLVDRVGALTAKPHYIVLWKSQSLVDRVVR